jgi:polyisoprenoid-binding protein YceI
VVIKIPVASIKSTKGKMMDNKTYNAFKHEKYPFIIFTFSSKKVNKSNSTIDVIGNISMAGVTKAITLTVNYKILPTGELQITGSKKLAMTSFQMEPPTAMMGTITVGDDVVIGFDLTLSTSNSI